MEILLKKMPLVNFKGIRSAEFDFNPTVNTVLGVYRDWETDRKSVV